MKTTFWIICMIIVAVMPLVSYAQDKTTKKQYMDNKKVLIAYFSRADENYNVGYIKKGNTEIIAEMIAEETKGTLFHIETEITYPSDYNECINLAKKEKNNNARPAIKGNINVEDYDVIFLGYPNWWGDVPMAVYTFIEKHKWQGKTVIPFCTHEGSGMGSTEGKLKKACQGGIFVSGLAVQGTIAQKNQKYAKQSVMTGLKKLEE